MSKQSIVIDDPRFLPTKKNKKKISKKLYKSMNASFSDRDLEAEPLPDETVIKP